MKQMVMQYFHEKQSDNVFQTVIQAPLFLKAKPEADLFPLCNLTPWAAAMCRDQNKASPRSYRQPIVQPDSRVDGAESSVTEHRAQLVQFLKRLLLRFDYKKKNTEKIIISWYLSPAEL